MPLNININMRLGTRAISLSLRSHGLIVYAVLSTLAVCAAILNALRNYTNFYSVAIYLSKSSRSVLVFANFGFILALLAGHVVQRIFFGPLRANEVERLYDRLWIFITESLLAFTIFRDEFDAPFALMFGSLLFIKSFHWLAADRIEWMDQQPYPGPSLLFHVRMSTLFLILWTADLLMLIFAVENTLTYGVGGMVLFACEYGILLATAANTIAKYVLSCYDFRRASTRGGENAPPWEQKSIWTFYFELFTDFSKLTTYLCFFTIILTFYGLPLNIVRDIYFTARSFVTRLKALRRYQTATRNMDERYPNATPEEMAASDHTCIICREEMALPAEGQPVVEGPNTTPKKLPCGHIFHFHCLRSWLERQQSCPTCRSPVLEPTPPATGQQPQGAQGGDARAAQPAPGAVPQPNGAAPVAQNRNGPANANAGAPMDLLRRLVATNPNPNRGNAGNAPVNLIIQYDVHNYAPRGRDIEQPDAASTSAPPVRRPPQFTGFHGPGGVWQPWNVDGAEAPNEAPPPAGPSPSTSAHPQPTPTISGPTATPYEEIAAATAPETELQQALNPREAAAQAALSRFDSPSASSTLASTISASQSTPESSQMASTSTPEENPTTSSRTATSTPPPPPSTQTTTTAAPSSSTPLTRIQMPSLIPLDINPHLTQSIPAHPPSIQSTRNPLRVHRPQRPTTNLAQLPPTMTPEQLAVMDRVTREAIDERLRVLDGVSGAVYRCIDELMRMRSTLPPAFGNRPNGSATVAPGGSEARGSATTEEASREEVAEHVGTEEEPVTTGDSQTEPEAQSVA